jgi:predicted nucleic acid-binding protein
VIVIDSSVWIGHFNGAESVRCERLVRLLRDDAELLIGDLILQEVLQGFAANEEFGKALSAVRTCRA